MDDAFNTASDTEGRYNSSGVHRSFSSFLYDRLVENLSILLPGGCAVYSFLTVAHLVVLEGATARLMASIALLTAVTCGVSIWAFKPLAAEGGRGRVVAFVVAGVVLANPLLHLQQTGAPRDTTMVAFVALCVGLVYVDRLQIYVLLAAAPVLWAAIAAQTGWSAEWTHFAFVLLFAEVLAVITFESRRRMYQTLFRQEGLLLERALTDPLTGLANRAALMENLTVRFAGAERDPDRRFAVCFIDLNGFKRVNDVYGHSVGDETLKNVGRILRENCRPGDLPARFGGDEFVAVYDVVEDYETAVAVGDRIYKALAEEFDVGGVQLTAHSSVGVVWSGHGYANPDELLEAADGAMYRKKRVRIGPGAPRPRGVEREEMFSSFQRDVPRPA